MRISCFRLLIMLGLLGTATALAPADEGDTLRRLFAERHRWESFEFPEQAMRRGDYTHAGRVADVSLAAIERRHRETVELLEWLHAIDERRLRGGDVIDYELFDLRLRDEIEAYEHREFLMPIGQRWGPHQSIPRMTDGVRFSTPEDYEDYVLRLRGAAASIDHFIERMRLGLAEGRTPPRVTIAGIPEQIAALLEEGGLAMLREPLERMPVYFSSVQRETLPIKLRYEAMPDVRSALERLHAFLVDEYVPGCRTEIAATALPNGDAYYAFQLRKMTTTTMTAQEIHDLGLAEVARIRAEMLEVIRRSDYLELHPDKAELADDELFAAFIDYLRTDPRFYHQTEAELLSGYRDICKRVDAWLPKFFRTLPRLSYGVKRIPDFLAPNSTTAYYQHGSIENAEPGYFYANTYALDQRPKYEMIALAMHEAVPGHHLQIALDQEREDAPDLLKNTWFTAFGEGWALYAERLGIEMGLYEDPYDDFGRLLYEMWRACRLVVDPGMHALGWSHEQATQFLLSNTALSELNIRHEVDRYIAWPGQACGYKIGELKIRELRKMVEAKFGKRFDIRAFHDVVLSEGSVPLPVLERMVKKWVRKTPGGAVYD